MSLEINSASLSGALQEDCDGVQAGTGGCEPEEEFNFQVADAKHH